MKRSCSGPAPPSSETSKNHLAALPNSFSWSIACPAPLSRSSAGRSALSTSSGTRASRASITAGAELRHRGARRARHRRRQAAALGEPEREEAGAALVDVRVAAQPRLAREREHQRRRARAGGGAGVAHPAAGQLVDERPQQHVGVARAAQARDLPRIASCRRASSCCTASAAPTMHGTASWPISTRNAIAPWPSTCPATARPPRWGGRSRSTSCVEHVLAGSPERFALCGYSFGGRIALQTRSRRPRPGRAAGARVEHRRDRGPGRAGAAPARRPAPRGPARDRAV